MMQLQDIMISDELSAYAQLVVNTGKYQNLSDYIGELIQKDKDRAEAAVWLQKIHDEAIASGPPIETTPAEIRDRMLQRIEEVRKAKERRAS